MDSYQKLSDNDEATGKIVYCVIARGQIVLTETSAGAGNFQTVTRIVLSKIVQSEENEDSQILRKSYKYDSYLFHYLIKGELCLAENSAWQKATFLFLDKVSAKFEEQFLNERDSVSRLPSSFPAVPLSLDPAFKSTFHNLLVGFNTSLLTETRREEMVTNVKKNIQEVKAVVVENIEKLLERGEKIELLVSKTDRMQETAFKFETSARTLKNSLWWQNARKYMMLFGIFLFVVLFLSATYCGGITYPEC